MFSVGEIIYYGSTGVCEVMNIGKSAIKGMPRNVDFYTLQPISENHREMIYVPVNSTAFMRPAISAEEANRYIGIVKDIEPVNPIGKNPKAISDFYSSLIGSYDIRNLLTVVVSLTLKKRECEEKGKRMNQTQTIFLKKAGEMIYNEFAIALNTTPQAIETLIDSNIL